METLSTVACKHLQPDYYGMQKSLQQGWAFVQGVAPNIRDEFVTVKKALRDSLTLNLFQGVGEGIPGRGVPQLPSKHAGMDLPDLTMSAPENWMASFVITGYLVAALRDHDDFRMADQAIFLREGRTEVRKRIARWSEKAMAETLVGAPAQVTRHSWRPLAAGDKDGGKSEDAAIESKWDITGSAGMLRLPIPAI